MTARRKRSKPGPKPRGTTGATVSKTVKLTPAELAAQLSEIGETPWATWARETLVAVHPPADEE